MNQPVMDAGDKDCHRATIVMTKKRRQPSHFKSRAKADAHAVKNRRLVFSQARYFQGLNILTYDELISEGDLAILRAARQWPGQGQFSTYAVTAIRRAMLRAIKRRKFLGQEPLDDEDGAWLHTLPADGPHVDGVDLSCLTPLEQKVIVALFGLDGPSLSPAATARRLEITLDQVERLRDTAIVTLRRAIAGDEE